MQIESRRFTFFLASIAALTSLSIDMSLPTTPAIEHEFHLAAGQGSLIMSLFLAGYAVTPLIGGPLADRLGRRSVLLVSLMLFALSALLCGLAANFTMLLVVRFLQGCASGVATTMPLAVVRDLLAGSAARKRMSEVTALNSVMPILAPIVGSTVVQIGSWRVLFGAQSIFAAGIVLALLLDFSETLPAEHRHPLHLAELFRSYRQLLGNRIFLGYALINALGFASIFSFISVSPLILIQRMGVAHAAYPVMFAAIAAGTILGGLASVVLNRRETPIRAIITSGLAIMVIGSVSAAASQIAGYHRPATLLPAAFATLFGFALIVPSVTLEALAPAPALAGAGSGALRSILMIFGSGTSAGLATYCAWHASHVEVATTLTMSFMAFLALAVYACMLLPFVQNHIHSSSLEAVS